MLYDFPRGFDERTLAELRNVLRNGSKCGIYTAISYLPDPDNTRSREYQQSLQSIIDLSTVINQNGENFVLRGLPLVYYTMPEKIEFAKFFSKYMLILKVLRIVALLSHRLSESSSKQKTLWSLMRTLSKSAI